MTPAGRATGASGRIVFVISSMKAGGAERVMALLATEWVRSGRPVTIITLGDCEDFYPLPEEVERVGLDLLVPSRGAVDALRNNLRRIQALRRAVLERQPAAVISFMDTTNVLTLMALRGAEVPVVVSERIDPRHYPIGRGWGWLRKKFYPRAAGVVVQTNAVAEWAREFVPAEKVHVIANPVSPPAKDDVAPAANLDWLPTGPYIAALGRLDPQKGFDLLLRAFAQFSDAWPELRLVIPGEGPERGALEALAVQLGVADRVMMPGRISNALPVLAGCRCFVLSSRFEGFPNALLEAMAMGAPVVSFDCPSGPADIIRDEVTGLLVLPQDVDALAAAIGRVLSDENLARSLGEAAAAASGDYAVGKILTEWEQVVFDRG